MLLLLLLGSAIVPALAQQRSASYQSYIDQAAVALDNGDTRAAYHAFAKAHKQARKNQDEDYQNAFRDCLRKIPYYETYLPLVGQAEHQLQKENYKNAQASLLAAREQLDLAIGIDAEVPAFHQYETNKHQALEARIRQIEAQRLPLLEQAIASGEDLLLADRPGEALEQFRLARDLALDQQDENRRYRIGERILKAELHYEVYTQLNLGRRKAGYRQYPEAQRLLRDALAKVDKSREYYFPRLENYDLQKYWKVEEELQDIHTRRTKTYEQAIRRGLDYLETDQPKEALKAFTYARQQMLEAQNEPQITGINGLLDQAQYQILVRKGDSLLQKANYREAIAAYEQAGQYLPTDLIRQKIAQARNDGYRQALARGRQAFARGDYEQARQDYDLAASFQQTPELQNLLDQHYQELLLQGQSEAERADYTMARNHYESARLFGDTPEIQERIGETQGGMDYENAYITGEAHLREGRIAEARASFERARTLRNSVEVQNQLFAIDDYQLALQDGRRALQDDDPALARFHFQNARDLFDTPEVDDWLRQTGGESEPDHYVAQSYDAPASFASRQSFTTKSVGAGQIELDLNTVLWMRPDCRLDWTVELYNEYGALVSTESINDRCAFTFANLADGVYTYRLKLKEGDQITTYSTEREEVTIRGGETVKVTIDAQ